MKRNSLYVYVESFGTTTPVPVDSEGNPVWDGYSGRTLQVLQDAYGRDKDNLVVISDPELQTVITEPNPMGFRNRLYGLTDSTEANVLFHSVYIPTTIAATNPATANAALTEARNILEGSLWNEPFSKMAFSNPFGSGSFDILKNFLSHEQITEMQKAAVEFNLV
jgi:hypothetical protein